VRIFPGRLLQGCNGLTLIITDTMEIDFCCLMVLVSQDSLDVTNLVTPLIQKRGANMSQGKIFSSNQSGKDDKKVF
jgi:hypothetical protein